MPVVYAEAYPTLLGLMVQHDQVSVLEVEAVQFIAGSLGIHDIFVDDESGALGVSSDALANLAVDGMLARGLFASIRVTAWFAWRDRGGVPNRPKFAKEVEQLLGGDVVAEVLDEECAERH